MAKPMRGTCRRKPRQKEKQNQEGYDKEEKKIPPIKITFKNNIGKIIPSTASVENSNSERLLKEENNASSEEKKGFNIADKVKLRKRGQNTLSQAEIFRFCVQSNLPKKKRRKSYSSSSSLSPPLSVEACATMSHSDCDKSLVPNFSHLPPLSYKRIDGYGLGLPVKKPKISKNFNEKNQTTKASTSEDQFDINQIYVASYEEVSSTEPGRLVPFRPRLHDLKDKSDELPTVCIKDEDACSHTEVEIPGLNTENAAKDQSEIDKIVKNLKLAVGDTTLGKGVHAVPLNECCNQDPDVDLSELKIPLPSSTERYIWHEKELKMANERRLDIISDVDLSVLKIPQPSSIERCIWHEKELKMADESSDRHISAMLNLALQIMPYSQKKSSTENVLVIPDRRSFELSAAKHSSQARHCRNITSLENKIDCTAESSYSKQFSRSSSGSVLSSKTYERDCRNNLNSNGVFRQENHAKEKRKAMDERCIVYVGNIPHGYSDSRLKERFRRFGTIKHIQIKSKPRCDVNRAGGHSLDSEEMRNFGFITFSSNQEATDAIEKGNEGQKLKFQLSFGARRQFVGEEYKDLDGIVAENENSSYKHDSRSSFLPQNKEDDYSAILKGYIQERGVKPSSFTRMHCNA